MDKIIASILNQLNRISVSGLDVERMYIAKNQLRQLQTMLTAPKEKKEESADGNNTDNV